MEGDEKAPMTKEKWKVEELAEK
ncbi:uncharacterized protein G2W53_032939 [Senna tora]|uniref:Uncharacterized protein n=1 Tax=Senna tora TaxID=362788 RepID=A0A834SYD9_9FABA|nr:uncharacterized protein G2W53_032939 [Senna tora]